MCHVLKVVKRRVILRLDRRTFLRSIDMYNCPGSPCICPGTPYNFPGVPDNYPGSPDNFPGVPDNFPGTPCNFPGTPCNYLLTLNFKQIPRLLILNTSLTGKKTAAVLNLNSGAKLLTGSYLAKVIKSCTVHICFICSSREHVITRARRIIFRCDFPTGFHKKSIPLFSG
jgi:hypothetical protein